MRTTTIVPGEERYPAALYLGRVGENLTRQIVFDCSALAEECGSGVAEIVAMTPAGTKYAPTNVTQEGSTVTWLISEADVGTAGRGRAELSWIVGDGVAKTTTWQTLIRASLTGTEGEDPPDVYKDWVDQLLDVAQQVLAFRDELAAAGPIVVAKKEEE